METSNRTTTVKGHIDVQMESQIFDMVNQYRKEQGLEERAILSPGSAAMQAAVDTRAVEISYSFSHTRPNGLTPFSFSDAPEICAENIAAGYPDAQSVMTGWKNSPGHNANMLEYIIDSGSMGGLRNMWERIAIHIIMFNCLVVNGSREKNQKTIYQKLSLFGSFFF